MSLRFYATGYDLTGFKYCPVFKLSEEHSASNPLLIFVLWVVKVVHHELCSGPGISNKLISDTLLFDRNKIGRYQVLILMICDI